MTQPSFIRATLAVLAASVFLTSCTHSIERPSPRTGSRRTYRLLSAVLERETARFPQKRTDVEVDSRDFDRTPRVVGKGETPKLKLDGARLRLYGDEAGTQGFSVDNFILFEVFDENGKRYSSAVAGFTDPVSLGNERVDNVGKLSFNFEPGEIDLTSKVPENDPFTLRATALDFNGVGRVSEVYVALEYPKGAVREEDDLRTH